MSKQRALTSPGQTVYKIHCKIVGTQRRKPFGVLCQEFPLEEMDSNKAIVLAVEHTERTGHESMLVAVRFTPLLMVSP